jgi:hypothetical protein
MAWGALPLDMEELILSKLSLVELARASRTCHTFRAFSGARTAEAQQARFDLAVACFGRESIEGLARLLDRYSKTGELGVEKGTVCTCTISQDGVLRLRLKGVSGRHLRHKPGEMWLSVIYSNHPLLQIHVPTPRRSRLNIFFCGFRKKLYLSVDFCTDEDLEGVALLQALLSSGLSSTVKDAWPHTDHFILRRPPWSSRTGHVHTEAGLEAKIAPLLPIIAQNPYLWLNPELWGCMWRCQSLKRNG